ncbi:MAG: aldo/keto reductase [Alphaproteobacteria bacterium]
MAFTLPPYGIGAAGLGNLYRPIPDADVTATLAAARDSGFTYLDTAPFYGHGLSELRLGTFMRETGWRPQLSTKVGRVLTPVGNRPMPDNGFANPAPFIPSFDYSAKGIETSFAGSQDRLGVEAVETLLLHDVGQLTHGDAHGAMLAQALDEALPAMDALKAAGKTKAVGLGVNEIPVCEEILSHRPLDCILLAGRYTLLEHDTSLPFLNDCHKAGTRIIVGGAFNSGLLATPDIKAAKYDYGDAPDWAVAHAIALRKVCAAHDVSLQAAALQFCAAHPAVASVIPGVQHVSHVTDARVWIDETIPAALWTDLKERGLINKDAPTPS